MLWTLCFRLWITNFWYPYFDQFFVCFLFVCLLVLFVCLFVLGGYEFTSCKALSYALFGLLYVAAEHEGVGGVAVLQRKKRFIYYLITKERYSHKPTYDTLRSSLKAMKAHCQEHQVTSLSMPRIGCGLDKLEWPEVVKMTEEIFKDSAMTITVYTIWCKTCCVM